MVADALPETPRARRPATAIALEPGLDEEWLRVFQAVERHWPPEQDPGARWVLGSGDAPRRFALARVDGEPAATGYARLEDDWLYIACVGTFPDHRRRGLARAVSERLFAWGAASGARRAILQAETKNAAAQALYAQLGFRPRYVYRDLVPGSAAPLTNTPSRASQGHGRVLPMPVQQGAPGGAGGTPRGLW